MWEMVCWVLTMFVREGAAENVGALYRLYLLPDWAFVPVKKQLPTTRQRKVSHHHAPAVL